MLNRLQYISQGATIEDQLFNIHQALDHGCDWVQMRFKTAESTTELLKLAEATKMLCDEYLATFIINDAVLLAHEVDADGVHLGLTDMGIPEARSILGTSKIIGGTANTLEDILLHVSNGCDYVGLGPFRYTKTKDKLSPILGIEGYKNSMEQLKLQQIKTPIYAIGGIQLEDVSEIIATGIHGIAVSGLITESISKTKLITQLNEKLYGYVLV
ncbi:thiamine-phosphate diphosphorylase [Flavobacterium faecale]|uniref:Thiamine-phosphate synthase n=1 Tax=Flavobacterium faecale TaxID=1355330 RepID=A0A2S1L9H1_9FLAO|nr:thiamine phosphate synthase [Flavobacterium faecale]AWG20410.1 thiamine-phosphate diphosphorylase [Flavobacterium faecale]